VAGQHLTAAPSRPDAGAALDSVIPTFRQSAFVVLSAMEHADDGDRPGLIVDGVGDHGAPPVVREPQAWADVLP